MLKKISPVQAYDMAEGGKARLVDIRESTEYAQMHIAGARLAPLSIIDQYPVKDAEAPEKPIVFFCHSGRRTENAADKLAALAGNVAAYQLEGGISGWQKAGLPLEQGKAILPMFRQIQIGAGALILLGVLGSHVWHPMYLLTAFVGAGLLFAGLTGFCGLGLLLARMPWNRR